VQLPDRVAFASAGQQGPGDALLVERGPRDLEREGVQGRERGLLGRGGEVGVGGQPALN
jgi:hypothetical protein